MKLLFTPVKVPSPAVVPIIRNMIKRKLRIRYRVRLFPAMHKAILAEIDDWDMNPSFFHKFSTAAVVYTYIMMLKIGKAGWIYTWVDLGTGIEGPKGQAYVIEPKQANNLEFVVPYQPKTIPPRGLTYSPGAPPSYVRSKMIVHPGIRPREITERMLKPFETFAHITGFPRVSTDAIQTVFDEAFRMGIL